jgi:CheY-like chemotaxis protein
MRVLFVEDDDFKRTRVTEVLTNRILGLELEIARSLQSGLRRMRGGGYSLIILDITLPNYDPGPNEPGGKPQLFGGREFLRQMDRFDIRTPVIVVTQFAVFDSGTGVVTLEDLDLELRHAHTVTYRGCVYYNNAIQGWKESLNVLLSGVLKENSTR